MTCLYNLSAKIIDVYDEDYGIWYLDMMEHPDRYVGKDGKGQGDCICGR